MENDTIIFEEAVAKAEKLGRLAQEAAEKSRHAAQEAIKRAEDLSNEAGIPKHLSFEMCRWTCALTDWRAGMEHDKIRQKLGISKIQWREVSMKLRQLSGDQ